MTEGNENTCPSYDLSDHSIESPPWNCLHEAQTLTGNFIGPDEHPCYIQ